MRVMPFLTADSQAVEISEPRLRCGDRYFAPNEPVENWDYHSSLQIVTTVIIKEDLFRSQTGLIEPDELQGLTVTLQADCPSTTLRKITGIPALAAIERVGSIQLEIPPGTVAKKLDICASLILDRPDASPRIDRVAHLRGSRLFVASHTWSFALEGVGGGFPTEAVDFASVGLPGNAPWHLKVRREIDLPFMGAVRLLVNTAHPLGIELLRGETHLATSALFYDLLVQMLLAFIDADAEDLLDLQEESLGAVLNEHTQTYTNMLLVDAVTALREDPMMFMTQLKNGVGLGEGN